MLSKLKISTVDQWRSKTIRPVFLFLTTMMLVIAYPGLSHSAGSKLIKYLTGVMQHDSKQSQEGERSTKDYEETVLTESEARLYQKVKTVLEHQKRLESINKELTEKLTLKNSIITSLEYNDEILWNQLEANEQKFWDALTAKDKEYQKANKLFKDKEGALKAQLEDNKKKFEIALAAIDPEYLPTEERESLLPNSLFGYSPPATNERSLKLKGYRALDSSAVWSNDAVTTNTTGNDHPWGSLVCTTCHDGITNLDNAANISPEITESSKNIFLEENIAVSDHIISNSLNSGEEIANNDPTNGNLEGDSIPTFKTWTFPPSKDITCNDQEPGSVCAEDSKTDSWWRWFNQKISKFKTNVTETVYSYL